MKSEKASKEKVAETKKANEKGKAEAKKADAGKAKNDQPPSSKGRSVKWFNPAQGRAIVSQDGKDRKVKYYLRRSSKLPTIGVDGHIAVDLQMWLDGKAELENVKPKPKEEPKKKA